MLNNANDLPNDPAALKGLVVSLASEVKSQALFIEKLKHQLAGMRQHRFGSRFDPAGCAVVRTHTRNN